MVRALMPIWIEPVIRHPIDTSSVEDDSFERSKTGEGSPDSLYKKKSAKSPPGIIRKKTDQSVRVS